MTHAHEELILRDALGLGDATAVNPSGGPLAGDPVMATGLTRVIEVAKRIAIRRGLPRRRPRSSGAALQQNLVVVLEGEVPEMARPCAVVGIGQTKYKRRRDELSLDGLVREAALAGARRRRPHVRRHRRHRDRQGARRARGRDDARAVARRRARRGRQADPPGPHRRLGRCLDRDLRRPCSSRAAATTRCSPSPTRSSPRATPRGRSRVAARAVRAPAAPSRRGSASTSADRRPRSTSGGWWR